MPRTSRQRRLRLDPRNARRHDEANAALIEASLREVGAFRSVAADANGVIRAGNKTYETAKALGYKIRVVKGKRNELIVVQRDDLKGKQAVRAALLDNKSSEIGSTWDADVIGAMVENERDLLEGLFSEGELQNLLWRGNGDGAARGKASDGSDGSPQMQYRVIVECESEAHQKELLSRFKEEGLTCRASSREKVRV